MPWRAGSASPGEIRRHEETFARMPLAMPSSPRYVPHSQQAIVTSTGASIGFSPIEP